MLQELQEYSAMIREKRNNLEIGQAELAIRSGVSTKTICLIEKEKWPENGQLSPHQQRGQARCLKSLAPVLGFNQQEWMGRLKLPNVNVRNIPTKKKLGREELEYLLKIVNVSGPINLDTALDLLSQRPQIQ